MSVAQASAMHVGLVQFLLEHVNRISGITATSEQLSRAVDAPLAKAAFVLAQEFGWTPQQVNDLNARTGAAQPADAQREAASRCRAMTNGRSAKR